ncbi:hypothetical protein HanHA300_Chr12g0433391 [Helianthus annuus]|nr:hypothetical protein HanHA300_Chr12g0433391 [Helianthus annuus]
MYDLVFHSAGGPKLRKWYGAPDLYADDGSNLEEADKSSEEDEVRDAVLVTDGDNEIGQTIILSLIIKRIRVKALVKDKRAAMESFGTYVEEGFLSKAESLKGVQHVVILSQVLFISLSETPISTVESF